VITDVLANLFGADTPALVRWARQIDAADIGALWVTDHFSGAVADRPFSRDPFVVLGALASTTERVDLGVLVANINNRHPVQLASAVNSLQSLAPGRVRLGVGSGAVPGSRFAVEHEAIGTPTMNTEVRRQHLRDNIRAIRAIWRGETTFTSPTVNYHGLMAVIDDEPVPHIVVGASAWATIEVAAQEADGVNIRLGPSVPEFVQRLRDVAPSTFEISVLTQQSTLPDERIDELERSGIDRLIFVAEPSFDAAVFTRRSE
jgi:alkanesulfonate monooxygenase SsuD/methylene tetrahydromethanopterin reductase-like flavin-dependent oxidoreductase (luciferase family)